MEFPLRDRRAFLSALIPRLAPRGLRQSAIVVGTTGRLGTAIGFRRRDEDFAV